jgi:predicted Fe-Mo cluster-binding NifX family protein
MEIITTAFATDNGKSFINRHFGDANYYIIYEISKKNIKFLKKIKNTTNDYNEEIHADPKKAKGVAELLKNEKVTTVVSKFYGPNIKRIRKKFVCILMNNEDFSECTKIIQKKIDTIVDEWNKGEIRNHLNLKSK